MSETAWSGERRARHAFYYAGFGEKLSPEQFKRLDVWERASYLALHPETDEEGYRRLKHEDLGGVSELDGPVDENGDWT